MNEVLDRIGKFGIVPVISVEDAEKAEMLGRALSVGGLPVAEITFRTNDAEKAIREISQKVPEVLVGAGTVLTCEQVKRALDAGARFIVSPGFNEKVVRYCLAKEVPVIPGCSSPTDIERALECGLEVVKFFPAEASGGLDYIKSVAAPYGQIKFVPTGGININNLGNYLAYEKVLACGGSWLTPKKYLETGNYLAIEDIVQKTIKQMLGFGIKGIGIFKPDTESGIQSTEFLTHLLFSIVEEDIPSVHSGLVNEAIDTSGCDKHGYIYLETNSIERAVFYLNELGIKTDSSSAKYDNQQKLKEICLTTKYGNFVIKIIPKD